MDRLACIYINCKREFLFCIIRISVKKFSLSCKSCDSSSKSSKFLSASAMSGAMKLKIAEFYCKKNSTYHEYRNNFFDSNKKIEVIDLEVEKLNN